MEDFFNIFQSRKKISQRIDLSDNYPTNDLTINLHEYSIKVPIDGLTVTGKGNSLARQDGNISIGALKGTLDALHRPRCRYLSDGKL